MHIFIQAGIEYYNHQTIHILEAGFGTGLNCYLTLLNAQSTNRHIIYHTYEKYPLTTEEINEVEEKQEHQEEQTMLQEDQ